MVGKLPDLQTVDTTVRLPPDPRTLAKEVEHARAVLQASTLRQTPPTQSHVGETFTWPDPRGARVVQVVFDAKQLPGEGARHRGAPDGSELVVQAR